MSLQQMKMVNEGRQPLSPRRRRHHHQSLAKCTFIFCKYVPFKNIYTKTCPGLLFPPLSTDFLNITHACQ